MDNQLMQDFNSLYFSKKQISRRIFEKEELGKIWETIQGERLKLSKKNNCDFKPIIDYWFNNTESIDSNIEFINEANNLGVFNYISSKIKDNLNKSAESLEISQLLSLNDIEISEKKINDIINIINNSNIIDEDFLCNLYNIIEMEDLEPDKINKVNSKNKYSISRIIEDGHNIENLLLLINKYEEKSILIKATVIHLYVIINNPFIKHNAIISELLTYKYLLMNGYEVIKYCSISPLIKEKLKKYNTAIENSLSSNGDITYFIKFYLDILRNSIEVLNMELNYKFGKKILKELIEKNDVKLEERCMKFINSVLTSKNNVVTIDDYKKKLNVSYETARSDLNYLVTLGFFRIAKSGKRYEYYKNDISTIVDNFEE
ncbi:hypothetical protein SDC9_61367 [bioreactor metagenome]|uniref:Fido domain-containing protein n=1 Tax=bioreactor metagenome TaxID=1076179 RepID=A0A644XFL4_9ZZZZ